MPRTASKESPSRPIPRGRSSAWSQPQADQPKVPVLFRLPIIEQASIVADGDATLDESNDSQSASAPSAFDPAEIAIKMNASAEPVRPEVVVQPKAAATQAPPAPVEQRKVDVATRESSPAGRSWWEHWSSGVVLILLVIALVTASIIAFNDSGKIDTEPMADSNSEFALNSIEIPDVQIPKPAGASTNSPAVQVEVPAEPMTVESPTVAQATLPAIPTLAEKSETTPAITQAPQEEASPAQEDQELVLDAFPEPAKPAEGLIPNTLELPANEPGLALEAPMQSSTPLHSATLMRPVAEQERELFAPKSEVQAGLPALPTGMQMTEKAKTGASPSLYDGADVAASRESSPPATSAGQTSAQAMGHSPIVDTNLPGMETLLGNAGASGLYRQVSQPSDSKQANFAVASHSTTLPTEGATRSANNPAVPSSTGAASGVVETSTPQSNIESLLGKWRQFKAMSEPGNTSNRYPND